MTRSRQISLPTARQRVGLYFGLVLGIWPPSAAKQYVRDLGLTDEDIASIALSEFDAPPPDPPSPVDGAVRCRCGHRRREHCGCGADCFASVPLDPPSYPSGAELDACAFFWRDLGDEELSAALGDFAVIPKARACGCAGFVRRGDR